MGETIKLVVGAGDRRVDGFKHHDVQPLDGLDYICDFWDLGELLPLGSVEEIHMTHVLEHFPMAETKRVLRTLHELLTPSGKLYLEVPNFEWHAQMITRDPMNRQVVEYAFGGQHNQWDFHYNGFTPDILRDDLLDADFRVDDLQPNSSIECWATKMEQ